MREDGVRKQMILNDFRRLARRGLSFFRAKRSNTSNSFVEKARATAEPR